MVRGQLGRTGRRQVGVEVQAVQVHDIGTVEPGRHGAANGGLRLRVRRWVEWWRHGGDGGQLARDLRALACDHDGTMAGCRQGVVDGSQYLLRPADRVRPHGCQRIGDAQHRQHIARAARLRQRAPVMPHSWRS